MYQRKALEGSACNFQPCPHLQLLQRLRSPSLADEGFCEDLARQTTVTRLSQLHLGSGVVTCGLCAITYRLRPITYGSRVITYGLRTITYGVAVTVVAS